MCDVDSMVVGKPLGRLAGMAARSVETAWGRGKMSLETSTGVRATPAPPCLLLDDDPRADAASAAALPALAAAPPPAPTA